MLFALLTLNDVEFAWSLAHSLTPRQRPHLERTDQGLREGRPARRPPHPPNTSSSTNSIEADAQHYRHAARRLARMRKLTAGSDQASEVDAHDRRPARDPPPPTETPAGVRPRRASVTKGTVRAVTEGSAGETHEHQVRLTAPEAITNLRTVLELCAAAALSCSPKTGRPSTATIRTLDAHLAEGDFYTTDAIASFAWPLLVQAGGLATLDGSRLKLTPAGRAALDKPPAVSLRQLWQRWLTHAVIDEFSRVDNIKGQRSRNVLSAAKGRRRMVHEALLTCPPDEWVDVDALFRTMRRRGISPDIARTERALWKLYLVDPEHGSLGYSGHHDWKILEGRYTLAVIFEYAASLGLIDIDYTDPVGARQDFQDNWGGDCLDALSRYDGLRSIRLNALGAYALGLAPTYQPSTPPSTQVGTLNVLPNLDIVALAHLDAADRVLLSTYATQTSDRVWTVSADSLLTALDSGRELDEFTLFLQQRSERELPSALTALTGDVHRRAEALIDLGHARVIECADPATATLIAHDRQLRVLCHAIGDRYLVVPLDQELKFRKALRKLGYVVPTRHDD